MTELHWDEEKEIALPNGPLSVTAVSRESLGSANARDVYRGYNGYIVERRGRRIIFLRRQTSITDTFADLRDDHPYDWRS